MLKGIGVIGMYTDHEFDHESFEACLVLVSRLIDWLHQIVKYDHFTSVVHIGIYRK